MGTSQKVISILKRNSFTSDEPETIGRVASQPRISSFRSASSPHARKLQHDFVHQSGHRAGRVIQYSSVCSVRSVAKVAL